MIVILIVRQSQKYFTQQQEYLGHVNGHVEEMFGGHLVMKAFNGEAESVKSLRDLMILFTVLPGNPNSFPG